jgi:hypothetical protein
MTRKIRFIVVLALAVLTLGSASVAQGRYVPIMHEPNISPADIEAAGGYCDDSGTTCNLRGVRYYCSVVPPDTKVRCRKV